MSAKLLRYLSPFAMGWLARAERAEDGMDTDTLGDANAEVKTPGGLNTMGGLDGMEDMMKELGGGKMPKMDDLLRDLGGLGGEAGLGGLEALLKGLGDGKGSDMPDFSELLKNLGGMGDLPGMGGMGGKTPSKKNQREKFCKAKQLFPVPKMDMFAKGNLVANGCGPEGMQQKDDFGLHTCCNRHDLCYSVCDAGYSWCEREFRKCMKKVCKEQGSATEQKDCQKTADGYSQMTAMGGEMYYMKGQKQACEETCLQKDEAKEKFKEFLEDFYKEYNPEQIGEIDETLEKYDNKEGQLWMGLLRKYGIKKDLVHFKDIQEEL